MPLLNMEALTADAPPGTPLVKEGPEPKPKEHTMMVATCRKCRGWYSMDYEEALPDSHYDMASGEPCHNPYDWHVVVVPYREDWRYAY